MMLQTSGIGRGKIALSVLSGLALTAGFPVFEISYAAWVALAFLLVAIRDVSVRQSFVLGIVTGMVHFATLLYWLVATMNIYGYLPLWLSVIIFIPLVFYLSLFVAAFSVMVRFFCSTPVRLLVMVPACWVCMEYLRTVAFTGFPWGLLGYTQAPHLYLIQAADIFGVYGLSFLIAFANAVIVCIFLYGKQEKWQGRPTGGRTVAISSGCLIVIILLTFIYGHARIQSTDILIADAEKLNIAVVQGNIEQAAKWDVKFRTDTILKYIRLSEEINRTNPDLIVWPETATPFYFKYHIEMTKMVLQAIRGMGTHFVVGSPTVEFLGSREFYYNSAYLVTPSGDIAARNDKVHLVPFGEYVPLKKYLPFIKHLVAQVGEFKSGKKGDTLKWAPADIGVLICYEIIFPDLASAMVANHAGLLVNITNDAWFGDTSAPYQHFSMAVFRAVENRRALIRAANTGISGFIDPAGRVLKRSGLFEDAAMTCSVPVINDQVTFYNRHGHLLVTGCFILMGFIIIIRFKRSIS